ncbi:hypothetical protein [Actinomadura logoneensis]|uniref:hypothetical protein n=1 Tax=Actinomadura logoneensis TaxID=2293572 RepID=UPI00131430A6|nr:hypothetical protein [Actinomadura logoneensis]
MSVVVGAVVNVATGLATQGWDVVTWVATAASVVVGAGVMWWLTMRATVEPETPAAGVSASGDGAIAAGGSVRGSSTQVRRAPAAGTGAVPPGPPEASPAAETSASGAGAIAAGGDVEDSRTEVTGADAAAS